MRLLRDLGRRKLRSALTITGITIGIMALVVFGSMANKIGALVNGGSGYYADKIIVSAKGGMGGIGGPMPLSASGAIAAVDGVDVVVPGATLFFDDSVSMMSMSMPQVIHGQIAGADLGRDTFDYRYANGRALTAQDEGKNVVVLGSDLARKDNVKIGDAYTLRGEKFQVVGILEPTLTAPDKEALVPLAAAQRLFVHTLAPIVAGRLEPSEVATGFVVYLKPSTDPQAVKTAIESAVPDTFAMTGKDFDAQIGGATGILNAILIGIGLLSLIVGGLSVINTMAMSVAERTREIGIKRAIGASAWRIRREIVLESALIGLIGGLLGLGIGALIVTVGNEAGRASATILFDLTLGTAVTSLAFATVLGAVAGFIPAWGASRLDPVTALRYE